MRPLWKHLLSKIKTIFLLYVLYKGNKMAYLRHVGARIGINCNIQSMSFGTEPWLIEIGNKVTITSGTTFITHDGSSRLFRETLSGTSKLSNCYGKIIIHDNCFIGWNSIILPNVEIGPNSIVGAGSIVNKQVPPNTVFAGVPAKEICTIDEYISNYKRDMIHINAKDRKELRRELTKIIWGEYRQSKDVLILF